MTLTKPLPPEIIACEELLVQAVKNVRESVALATRMRRRIAVSNGLMLKVKAVTTEKYIQSLFEEIYLIGTEGEVSYERIH